MSVEENIHVSMMTESALNAHDFDAYEKLHAERCIYIGPVHPEPMEGAKALTDDLRTWANAFPDLQVKRDLIIGQGDWVC
jgi:hypothetical protein